MVGESKMARCFIQIAGGIGNVIQSVPFIKECRKYFDEVYGLYTRQDFTPNLFGAIKPLIIDLFDDILDRPIPSSETYFSTPIEQPVRGTFDTWDEPEYAKWFTAWNLPKPNVYDTKLNWTSGLHQKHNVVVWAGCKPIWKSKRWPHWGELCERYKDVAIVGFPDEGENIPPEVTDYRGIISLQDTASIISQCNMYIGNEGGTSHLAAAVGARTYIIYGASDHKKNFPPPRDHLYRIALNLPCQPCQFVPDRGFSAGEGCPELSCLKYLTVDMVEAYIDKSFQSYSTPRDKHIQI
jgi:hypothetical protein